MTRRKLYSDEKNRIKLFSDDDNNLKSVICRDCGYKMETASSSTDIPCPKCGGTRFNVDLYVYSPDVVPEKVPHHTVEEERECCERKKLFSDDKERRKLFTRKKLFSSYEEDEMAFQKQFSIPSDNFEKALKTFSGQTLSMSDYQKNFSKPVDELVERGFAEITDNNKVTISDTAYAESKLFSSITITITKQLDLEPEIVCNPGCNKEEIIERLGNTYGCDCSRGIMLIKKAHGISTADHEKEWLNDSGILGDLGIEFGGQKKDLPEFKNMLNERYPDAPDNIMKLLADHGVIRPGENIIEIIKK